MSAVKDFVPLANQAPLAWALVVISVAFVGVLVAVVWMLRNTIKAISSDLSEMVVINRDQAKSLVEMLVQIDTLATMPAALTVVADRLGTLTGIKIDLPTGRVRRRSVQAPAVPAPVTPPPATPPEKKTGTGGGDKEGP